MSRKGRVLYSCHRGLSKKGPVLQLGVWLQCCVVGVWGKRGSVCVVATELDGG